MNGREIVTAALRKIRVKRIGYDLTAEELQDGMEVLNTMLKGWSADDLAIPWRTRETLTLTSGTNPHTIGSGGDLNTTQPLDIHAMTITEGGVDYPVDLWTVDQFERESTKDTSARPEYVYFERGSTLGNLYFDSTPASNYTMTLQSLKPLTPLTSADTSSTLPDEAERAVILNLAIELADEYGKPLSPTMVRNAAIALSSYRTNTAASRVPKLRMPAMLTGGRRFNINTVD